MFNSAYKNNTLENQDFLTFSQIFSLSISNLTFADIQKSSDKARFVISILSLTLQPALSQYMLKNINFTNSESSFLSVAQVALNVAADSSDYSFVVRDCAISNNTLSSKDSLFDFGEINYINFEVLLSNVNLNNNVLELGTLYSL